jgi:prefoldin subunit 5
MIKEEKIDYKELFLRQKIETLQSELQMIQVRFSYLQQDLPRIRKELNEYIELKKKHKKK